MLALPTLAQSTLWTLWDMLTGSKKWEILIPAQMERTRCWSELIRTLKLSSLIKKRCNLKRSLLLLQIKETRVQLILAKLIRSLVIASKTINQEETQLSITGVIRRQQIIGIGFSQVEEASISTKTKLCSSLSRCKLWTMHKCIETKLQTICKFQTQEDK